MKPTPCRRSQTAVGHFLGHEGDEGDEGVKMKSMFFDLLF